MTEVITFAPQLDRPTALRPIIEQVLQLIKQRADQSGTLKISVGLHTIEITPWERAQLADVAACAERASDVSGILVEGIAAQARALNNFARLAGVEPDRVEQRDRCRRDIAVDLALGESVRRDAERLIAGLGAAGRTAVAMNLEAFVTRMTANLAVVRVGADGGVVVPEDFTENVPQAAEPPAAKQAAARAAAPASPAPPQEDHPAARRTGLSLKHGVLAGAATAVLIVGTLLGIPLATQRYEVEDGLRFVPGIESWSGSPPAATVTVAVAHWQDLSRAERTALVFAVAAAVQKKGFTEVTVLDSNGARLASWSRGAGVRTPD